MISVLIADDQALIRGGFRAIIGSDPNMSILGEAQDGAEAVALTRTLHPDVVVMDVRMPGMDGIAATESICADESCSSTRILILTTFELDASTSLPPLQCRSQWVLGEGWRCRSCWTDPDAVAAGESLLSPGGHQSPHQQASGRAGTVREATPQGCRPWTARERQVVALEATGLSNDEIAGQLKLSPLTAKTLRQPGPCSSSRSGTERPWWYWPTSRVWSAREHSDSGLYRNGSTDKCPQLDDDIRGPARLTGRSTIEVVEPQPSATATPWLSTHLRIFTCPARHRHRVPRAQRRGQVDHDADDHGAGSTDHRARPGERQAPGSTPGPDARGRCVAGGQGRYIRAAVRATTCWDWLPLPASSGQTGAGDEVLELVGLTEVARKRAGAFSLGMGQRLGIAAALLGDPAVVMLDEPVNGLDPEGVRWIRYLLQDLAAQGRTVFVSSHLMNEMAVTAEHLIIVGRGRLIADVSLAEFTARSARNSVLVRTDRQHELRLLLQKDGVSITEDADGSLEITGFYSA